jgi:hypothetical protein
VRDRHGARSFQQLLFKITQMAQTHYRVASSAWPGAASNCFSGRRPEVFGLRVAEHHAARLGTTSGQLVIPMDSSASALDLRR